MLQPIVVWDGEQAQDNAQQNGYSEQQLLNSWYLQKDRHGFAKDLGKETHSGVSLPSFHYFLMESHRSYEEHIGKTCWGGRLSRNPQSWVVMTAAESMQEMYRSWVLEQQGLQITSLIHYIFKHHEAYTTSH